MKAHKISNAKIPLQKLTPGEIGFTAGVYVLYRTNMGAPAFVGRADHRLYDHLSKYRNHPTYRYAKIMKCDDPKDAFEWHCLFWHKSQSTIDNSELNGGHHPNLPYGMTDLECPFPGCRHVFESRDAQAPEMEYQDGFSGF